MHTRIGINGFGRTGRATFRAAYEQGADLEWVGINDVMDIEMLAHLLRHDSVYGPFPGAVEVLDGAICVDDWEIPVFGEADPAALPWGEVGAEVVIESTGRFRDRAGAAKHLEAGAQKVIISAPLPTGSLVDLTVELERETSAQAVNHAMRDRADQGDLTGILSYSEEPLVSTDVVRRRCGRPCTSHPRCSGGPTDSVDRRKAATAAYMPIAGGERSVERRDLLRDLSAARAHRARHADHMPRILVLYASTHGHTAKIAARIAATLEDDGSTVDLHQLHANKTQPAPSDYDAVILGASIHAGHHQRALVRWAERHHTALAQNPSAFFSVCLTAADDTEESRAATRGYLDDFVEKTDWTPGRSATFAGAVQYREYDVATRALMRLLMRRMHHPTDASQDYDYTDWDAVERWAHELAATITPCARTPKVMSTVLATADRRTAK